MSDCNGRFLRFFYLIVIEDCRGKMMSVTFEDLEKSDCRINTEQYKKSE